MTPTGLVGLIDGRVSWVDEGSAAWLRPGDDLASLLVLGEPYESIGDLAFGTSLVVAAEPPLPELITVCAWRPTTPTSSHETVVAIGDATAEVEQAKIAARHLNRLEKALDIASDGLWDWKLDTNELYLSPAWFESLGFEPDELPQNLATWESLVHPDDLDSTWEALNRHFHGESDRYDHVNRLRTKSGNFRWNNDIGRVIERDAEGRPVRMVGIDKDIHRTRVLETALQRSQKSDSIGALAGGIAHDFNNLLSPIIGYGELLVTSDDIGSKEHRWAQHIVEAGEKARDLVHQILRFARSGEEELRPIDVASEFETTLTLLRTGIDPNIDLRTSITTRRLVLGDAASLQQLLLNVCTNASQAMSGGGTLTVQARDELIDSDAGHLKRLEAGTECVRIDVTDTGTGIDAEVLPHIFDLYFTTKPIGGGTGIGLSVVEGVVARMGGEIQVDTEPGEGSTFTIWLPSTEAIEPDGVRTDRTSALAGRRALVVDDDPMVLPVLTAGLERVGMVVESFNEPAEAVERFERDPKSYDVIVTDMAMPHMTGFELARACRQVSEAIPVVVVSGYGQDYAGDDVWSVVSGWIAKPVRIAELLWTIHEVMHDDEPAMATPMLLSEK